VACKGTGVELILKKSTPVLRPSWDRLKSGNVFQGAFVENGTVAWPGNIDIDPETLYEHSIPLSDSNLKINTYQRYRSRIVFGEPI